jgi:predicted ATPase/DNA-binding CsgD family transcriptional regulator
LTRQRLGSHDANTVAVVALAETTVEAVVSAGSVTGVPIALTKIVGREAELARACAFLRGGAVRVLTLTGPGGVGKTRLALEIAAKLAVDFAGAVGFVSLAPVDDPTLVLPTIARALGVRESTKASPLAVLTRAFRETRLLLVLDNFEQVVAAAPDVGALLDVCPRWAILATSRVPLRLTGEQEIAVLPLATADAVALFGDRARAARQDLALAGADAMAVAEICARLDGLPLAIELAAARCKVLSPRALAARLGNRFEVLRGGRRDAPPRQQTMRAAVAWSYDLLAPENQALFRRLTVFTGGFTLEAAEYVGGEAARRRGGEEKDESSLPPRRQATSPPAVFDGIAELIDQSLVHAEPGRDGLEGGPARFGMLETIRAYGLEQLAESGGEASTRQRHADWCRSFAELADSHSFDAVGSPWLEQQEAELDNFRAAFDFLRRTEDAEGAARLVFALRRFLAEGHLSEGVAWAEWVLARKGVLPARARAGALLTAAILVENLDRHERAVELGEISLRLAQEEDDDRMVADALHLLGTVAMRQRRFEQAADFFSEAIVTYRRLGHTPMQAFGLAYLATVAIGQGDLETAAVRAEVALRFSDESGFARGRAAAEYNLAEIARLRGDLERAADLFGASLVTARRQGEAWATIECLVGLAAVAAARRRFAEAGRLFGAAEAVAQRMGVDLVTAHGETAAPTEVLRVSFAMPKFAAAREDGRKLGLDDVIAGSGSRTASVPPALEQAAVVDRHGLTEREFDVLRELARGRSNREIADALQINVLTVKTHVANILAKYSVNSRAAATAYAHRHRLVD